MVPEAPLERTDTGGVYPAGEGWFVVNVRDARWFDVEGGDRFAMLDSEEARFTQLGFGIGILQPGEPSCMYHAEETQEGFLVLSGECLLIVEGQERPLKAWDFVHSPPWTKHVFVGAGDGPCVLVGVGARRKEKGLRYPVDETALKHGAGVEEETSEPSVAYAKFPEAQQIACPDDFPPW